MRARKLKVILQLIVNEPPTHNWLNENRIPSHYISLVSAVNRGDHATFGEILQLNNKNFVKDGVAQLLDKMRSVVMKNALKKLSVAYSRISISDVLKRIGADESPHFELNAFLTKSREDLPEFTIDHKSQSIEFTRNNDSYFSAQTRESLIRRIKHLQGMEEQVVKSLKFKVQSREVVKEDKDEKSEEDDDHFSDYSVNDLDM